MKRASGTVLTSIWEQYKRITEIRYRIARVRCDRESQRH